MNALVEAMSVIEPVAAATRVYAVKVELDPTPAQVKHLDRLAADRRLGWNELIIRRKIDYHRCRDFAELRELRGVHGPLPPTTKDLSDLRKRFPQQGVRWATAIDRPINKALEKAWDGYRAGRTGVPQLKKHDDTRQSFGFQVQGNHKIVGGLKVPTICEPGTKRLQNIRYKEDPTPRIHGKVVSATVSRDVDRWYVAICIVDAPMPGSPSEGEFIVGVDLNTHVIACSDGRRFEIPSELAQLDEQVREAQRALAKYRARRRRAGMSKRSNRYRAEQLQLGKIYRRMRFVRANWLHHVTTELTKTCSVLVLEDLRVLSMSKSAKGTSEAPGSNVKAKAGLNRSILNASFAEFRRQCEYKGLWYGCRIDLVDPAYTSRTCSSCQAVNEHELANYRTFVCESCGYTQDRDDNAAANIRFRGVSLRTAGGTGEDVERIAGVSQVPGLPASTKRQRLTVSRSISEGARNNARKTGDRPRRTQCARSAGAKSDGAGS